jgi:type I site-specific restriction endonuclease
MHDSEFRAYVFIENSLKEQGWDIRNPAHGGNVYTQQECLDNPIIKQHLQKDRPENIILVKEDCFWIVEAKPHHKDLEKAKEEVRTYAKKLNKNKILAPLISVVVGNDNNSYLVETYYLHKNKWERVCINDQQTSGFISKELARQI